MDEDVYFKKIITFRAWKRSLQFRVSQDLFSSHTIDLGTKFLLRTIIEAQYEKPVKILDIGCGYGPIGLTLKSIITNSMVHMVDRDALAVDYSRQNAVLNGVTDIDVYGGLGYDDLKAKDFDLIVSNIPGKAGESVISYLLTESVYYLVRNGVMAVVVVSPLEQLVEKVLNNTPAVDVLLKRTRSGHSVFHYRFRNESQIPRPDPSALERGVYDRTSSEFHVGNLKLPIRAAYNLPEFDSLSYGSEMVIQALHSLPKSVVQHAVVLNPVQGHVPVTVWKLFQPERITLIDRDLLALRFSKTNLILNECPDERVYISHQTGIELTDEGKVDLFVIRLKEENRKINHMIIQQASEKLSDNGVILVAANSTGITRLIADIQASRILSIRSRERERGNSVLVLKPT
ncbi:class I SAM-dependent methyltransferase [Chloroflexota bacterium]